MTKRKLRKNADISPPQSPHDGIHTCSKGCKKPGCNRTLRDTIEEQNQQIEALKRDVLKNARLRSVADDNKRECEATRIENARLKKENEKYQRCLNGERDWVLMEPGEHARLKAEVERLTKQTDYERMYRETIELLKKNNL
jgi:hypothetical protein